MSLDNLVMANQRVLNHLDEQKVHEVITTLLDPAVISQCIVRLNPKGVYSRSSQKLPLGRWLDKIFKKGKMPETTPGDLQFLAQVCRYDVIKITHGKFEGRHYQENFGGRPRGSEAFAEGLGNLYDCLTKAASQILEQTFSEMSPEMLMEPVKETQTKLILANLWMGMVGEPLRLYHACRTNEIEPKLTSKEYEEALDMILDLYTQQAVVREKVRAELGQCKIQCETLEADKRDLESRLQAARLQQQPETVDIGKVKRLEDELTEIGATNRSQAGEIARLQQELQAANTRENAYLRDMKRQKTSSNDLTENGEQDKHLPPELGLRIPADLPARIEKEGLSYSHVYAIIVGGMKMGRFRGESYIRIENLRNNVLSKLGGNNGSWEDTLHKLIKGNVVLRFKEGETYSLNVKTGEIDGHYEAVREFVQQVLSYSRDARVAGKSAS